MRYTLPLLAAFIFSSGTANACSCMGNNSFCETLDTAWFEPDAVALIVPLESYYYGMRAQVIHLFGGMELADTIMIWGDNGGLCRIGMGFAPGDTVVFGLNVTDFGGNIIQNPDYPPDLEQEGDYMVSGCGIYALQFMNNRVVGWVTGPQVQTMTLDEFTNAIFACSVTMGVREQHDNDLLRIADNGGRPTLALPSPRKVQLRVLDAVGRCIIDRNWDGSPFQVPELPAGTYVAQLRIDGMTTCRRIAVSGAR